MGNKGLDVFRNAPEKYRENVILSIAFLVNQMPSKILNSQNPINNLKHHSLLIHISLNLYH